MAKPAVTTTDLDGLELRKRGKVRDLYDLGLLQVRGQLVERRHEAVFGPGRHHDALGATDPDVMVVVPRRNRVNDLVAGVDDTAVGPVENRPRAARDQD